jgi:predicted nucleic acid-binding protein
MIIFDSSYLIAFLHPNPKPPKDEGENPVERFKDRIAALIESVNASGEKIGIPAPVVTEIFVLYPESKYDYLEIIRDRYRFEFLPFGVKAAIEASDLIAMLVKETKQPKEQWAKVKFDIQIAAIAKAESATILYADDKGVINNAKRLKIDGKRICDLPLPPEELPQPAPPPAAVDTDEQGQLFAAPTSKEEEAGEVVQTDPPEVRADSTGGAGNLAGTGIKEGTETPSPEIKTRGEAELGTTATLPPKSSSEKKTEAADDDSSGVDRP